MRQGLGSRQKSVVLLTLEVPRPVQLLQRNSQIHTAGKKKVMNQLLTNKRKQTFSIGLVSELIVYQWLKCPSSIRLSIIWSNTFFKHLLWNQRDNWNQISPGDSLGWRKQKFFQMFLFVTKMAATSIYGKNSLKVFFSRSRRPVTLGLSM